MFQSKRIVSTIEARMTSTRLPGKVLLPYCNKPNLQHIIERLRRSRYVDDVVVATTVNPQDHPIVALCESLDCRYYRGSEEDVLARVLEAARSAGADVIVEATGDCPLIDWNHVDHLIELFFETRVDYASNFIEKTFPVGLNVQVFSLHTLEKVSQLTDNPVDHEHVSLYIYTHPEHFTLANWSAPPALAHPEIQVTLDTREDYELLREIYERLYPSKPDFTADDVLKLLMSDPDLMARSLKGQRKDAVKEQQEWLSKKGR